MGLITKTVKIFWRYYNREEYENKGYEFTGIGHLFEIKIGDLFKTSKRIVECECDKCGKEIKMKYIDYNKKSTEDGQIFCEDCEPYYIDNGNNKKFSGIYKIENLVDGKVYIGQSNDVKRRWKEHKRYMTRNDKKQLPLYKAMVKYGIENFSFKVLIECSVDDMNELEMFYIEAYDSFIKSENSKGYNTTLGGEGTRGFGLSGVKNPMYGKHHSVETRQKISKVRKEKYSGENHPMYGTHRSEETKQKLRDSWTDERKEYHRSMISGNKNPRYGKHRTEEEKKKISLKLSGGGNPNSKKVICEDKIFLCVKECAEYYGLARKTVSSWLNGTRTMPQEFREKRLRFYNKEVDINE